MLSRQRALRIALALMPVAFLMAVPSFSVSNRSLSLATTAVIYAAIATGLGLIYGQLGLLSMSHAALWGVGSYTAFLAVSGLHWSFWAALPLAVAVSATAGGLTAIPAFRLRGHYLLIVTFVITELAVVIESHWRSLTGGPEGIIVARPPDAVLGLDFGSLTTFYYLAVVVLALLVLLAFSIARSRLGRVWAAIRENQALAESVGINTRFHIWSGFVISGVFAGAGGTVFAFHLKQIEPSLFGLEAAVLLPLIVLMGGARHVWGPTVGAFIVVFLPEIIHASPTVQEASNGALLIVIILLMPNGVLGALNTFAARSQTRRRSAVPRGAQ